ncbi:IcmT/TraK family protein [Paracoccus sp. ME4]|uniref:IcmT/TraK family protein n=1 Tax=Paracoccus sp. ME4 TaxID=3138066 RepID=UPI00398B55D4
MYGSSLYWRETHRQPRFLIFDGRIVVLLLVAIMHFRVWTILLALIAALVLWFFDRKGISADSIFRYLRARLVGRKRSARGPSAERTAVDFGFETVHDVARMKRLIEGRSMAASKAKRKGPKASGPSLNKKPNAAG